MSENPPQESSSSSSQSGSAGEPKMPMVDTPPPLTAHAETEPSIPFDIGQEYGTAEKNLPPLKILAICIGILIVVVGIYVFVQRPVAGATGAIGEVVAAEVPDQNSVLVAINISFKNGGEQPYRIHNIKAELTTDSGSFSDDAASAVDFDRYFQAFPTLKEHALQALKPEDQVAPGGETAGTIIVSFPVRQAAFDARKSLQVTVWAYDREVPLILTK
jgi:hypothetical protein